LRSARQHAVDVHSKVVLASWLKFERREDELIGLSAMDCCGRNLECPRACLMSGYDPDSVKDPCVCLRWQPEEDVSMGDEEYLTFDADEDGGGDDECDMSFCIGDDEIRCVRYNVASLSRPFRAMLYGEFKESWREKINFTQNGISAEGMRGAMVFSQTKRLGTFDPKIVLELLSLANRFCCEELKSACDAHLASLVCDMESAVILIEYGLEEGANLLVAACLQLFLRELPFSMNNPYVMRLLCGSEGRERLASVGHSSFLLYYFLSQIAMEEEMKSNNTVMLLERLGECATEDWQKQLAYHLLGVVMLERKEYKDAQNWFEEAVEAGHIYSSVGVARAKYHRGHKYSAYKMMNSLISVHSPVGWMYQERSLYCTGKEKLMDLNTATELDPTLPFPYKCRAVLLVQENKLESAISELNKIIGFKVSPDCLELRAWISMALEDFEGALRDVRALLTMDPNHMMFYGKKHGDQLVELLRPLVQQYSQADCWMQLHDRWSSVDDIGSLAVVHQMLSNGPWKSLLRFRQSLLLLRLNCQKAAMRSLRLARNYSTSDHERLVYEGWILYDTGNHEEALSKAGESISIQRSFEAFFLKAYALADSSLDPESSKYVIQLLEEALRCPSDGLRKGQALNNLGSVYVDCEKLDLAADCYMSALEIKHTRAHQGLARVHHLKNQRKAAYDEMTKLIEKARNNASAYEKRSEYCDRDMAKSDLSMATQLDPLRTYPYRHRAAVLMDDHKEVEAIKELTRVIAFKPDLQLLHLRAAFYDSMGDNGSTLRDCEAALCLDPNHKGTIELYKRIRQGGHTSNGEIYCATNSQAALQDTSDRIRFCWEQSPGNPRDRDRDDIQEAETPLRTLPPCSCHLQKAAAKNDITALAASSALCALNNSDKKLPYPYNYSEEYVSRTVGRSYPSHKGCGLEVLLPWCMEHKLCGVKSFLRQVSPKVHPHVESNGIGDHSVSIGCPITGCKYPYSGRGSLRQFKSRTCPFFLLSLAVELANNWPELIGSLLNNMTSKIVAAALKQATLETLGYVCETNFDNEMERNYIMKVGMKRVLPSKQLNSGGSICDEEIELQEYGTVEGGDSGSAHSRFIEKALPYLVPLLLDTMLKQEDQDQDDSIWNVSMAGGTCLGLVARTVGDSIVKLEKLERIVAVLLESINDAPNVAEKVCGAIYYLAQGYEDAGTSSSHLTQHIPRIISELLKTAERTDGSDFKLRTSAYETLNEVVRSSNVVETSLIILELLKSILHKLGQTLELQIVSSDDREKQGDLQASLCAVIQVIIQKLSSTDETKPSILQAADPIMFLFLRVFACRSSTVHEEAMLAIGALAHASGPEFEKYMPELYKYLEMGLQNFEEYEVCAITVGVIGDICRALEDKVLPYCDGIMNHLVCNLQSAELNRSVKPPIFSCFGDIALAIGEQFSKYIEPTVAMMRSAAEVCAQMDNSDEELMDYGNQLKRSIFEAYSGILQGFKDSKPELMLPHAGHLFQFIELVFREKYRDESVTKAAVAVMGDLADALGPNTKILFKDKAFCVQFLGECLQSEDEHLKETANWTQVMIARVVS
ncbi:hypothetical protein D5086_012660, partial [Populus alba]